MCNDDDCRESEYLRILTDTRSALGDPSGPLSTLPGAAAEVVGEANNLRRHGRELEANVVNLNARWSHVEDFVRKVCKAARFRDNEDEPTWELCGENLINHIIQDEARLEDLENENAELRDQLRASRREASRLRRHLRVYAPVSARDKDEPTISLRRKK